MKEKYLPRLADAILKDKLETFGAVYIAGPKWCGKTSTAERQANSTLYMQDPDSWSANMKTADTKPSLLLLGDKPRLLDEWQMAPVLWDAVRFAVDKTSEHGQYILTGSTTIKDGSVMHTGAGRIARMVMRPMSLYESGESTGQISLKELFDLPKSIEGISKISVEEYASLITRGGWPEAVLTKGEKAVKQVYEYLEVIINSDISNVDNVSRNPQKVRSFMRSIARNVSSQATLNTIRADMASDEEGISENTVSSYMNALSKLFVIEDLPAWSPSLRSKTTIRTAPTRHFVDPSIAAALLRVTSDGILKDFNTFGLLFESLCIRDLRIYADAIDGDVFHYRDSNGLETDAIIQLRDGRWGAIEIKMGFKEVEKAAENLLKFRNKINTEKMNEPTFLIILTASDYAYKREDGIYIVPIGCLKD